MRDETSFSAMEKSLSEVWGKDVSLRLLEQKGEHQNVWRLAVRCKSPEVPQTVILKRWRSEGQERYSEDFSASHFFNDWAGLEFLSTLFAEDSPSPEVYYGDENEGYFLLEDIPGSDPLQALLGNDRSKATDVLIQYGEFLGTLHGKTSGNIETYTRIRHQLGPDNPHQTQTYLPLFQEAVNVIGKVNSLATDSIKDEIHETAEILSQPKNLSAFTHGDPVFGNLLDWQGTWHLIDFEAARFRHALLEGSFPRLFFPTSGLNNVLRIPEKVWRQAETAYRTELGKYHPDIEHDPYYGSALTTACTFWVLSFCQDWLARALEGNLPPKMVTRIRQSIIARAGTLVMASREYKSKVSIADLFENLVKALRSQWTEEDCNLPTYPVFS